MKRSSSEGSRGRLALAVLLGIFCVSPVQAQQQEPREHTVKRGDTLWELARTYLSNPFLWPLIYEANRQVVDNPHWIFPAERLVIPPLPGEVRPGEPQEAAVQPVAAAPVAEKASYPSSSPRRTRFYAPPDTATLPTLIMAAPAAARRVEPREYYATPWLAEPARLNVVGTIFKPADPRNERDALPITFHPFDRLHIAYSGTVRPNPGDQLLVVSVGRKVPGFGRVIEPTGVVRVDSLQGTTMLAMVTHQFGNLGTGNLVIPMDSFPEVVGEPARVQNGPEGVLIQFLVSQPVYATYDQGFISLGAADGIKVGDEFVALLPTRKPERTRAETLPAQPIARLLVTRVAASSSTVRVVHLQNPVLKDGLTVQLVARTP